MMTGDNWNQEEQATFNGTASALVLVTGNSDCAANRYEFRLECKALGTYMQLMDVVVFFWDDRASDVARAYYQSTFEIGSIWRISGKIEYDDGNIVFVDPVYMPYSGKACERLKKAASESR